jgi:hypothetical protein
MELKIPHKGAVKTVLIDDADYDLIKNYSWHIKKARKTDYVKANAGCKTVYLHRLIMGLNGPMVDHKNRNGLDCRRDNLRHITKSGNQRNSKYKKKSNLPTGVNLERKTGKFYSRIKINNKSKYIGTFDNAEDAGYAYEAAYTNQIKKEESL